MRSTNMLAVFAAVISVSCAGSAPAATLPRLARAQEIGTLPADAATSPGCTTEATSAPPGWLFRAPGSGAHPAVLMLHKGFAYDAPLAHVATRALGRAYAAHLCPLGVTTFALDYRASAIGLDEMRDVAAAHDLLVQRPDVDARRIIVMGGSHGGYMALRAVTDAPRDFAAAVALYTFGDVGAVLRRRALDNPSTRETIHRLGAPAPGNQRYRAISPLYHLDGIAVPALLIAATRDQFLPDMRALHAGLVAGSHAVEYHEVAGARHGFEVGETVATDTLWRTATEFIARVTA